MEIQHVDLLAIFRMLFIFAHVIAVITASAGIALGDYAILSQRRIDTNLLLKAGRIISVALSILWLTGLVIIWIDTQFEWPVLITSSKLIAKLTVVSILTLNGIALHSIVFKRLQANGFDTRRTALLLTVLGAISGVTWLYAVFIGLAKPVANLLGISGFLGLYFIALLMSILVALVLIKPKISIKLRESFS